MRKHKKSFFVNIFLLLVLLTNSFVAVIPQNVYGDSPVTYKLGDNVTGTLSSDGTLVVSGTGDMYDYDSYGDNISPLYGVHFSKLIIEDGVTSVGSEVFRSCVYLEEAVIAGSVRKIGVWAFVWCYELRSIVLKEGVESLEYGAFSRCRSLRTVELPNSLKTISAMSFYGCFDLKNFSLPSSLNSIGESAFGGCILLESIYIPEFVKELDMSIMGACSNIMSNKEYSLKNIYVSPDNKYFKSIDGVLYSKDGKELIWYPEGRTDNLYKVCDGTEIIGEYSLANWKIKKVQLPESVTKIGVSAFAGAYELEEINLPDSLKRIEYCAFQACWKINNIVVPRNVNFIGACAFSKCLALEDIYILNPNVTIGRVTINGGEISDYVFSRCPESLTVHTYDNSTMDKYLDEFTTGNRVYDLQPEKVMNICYRTEEEIREYLEKNPVILDKKETFEEEPSLSSPYSAGKLSEASLQNALNTINAIRYIAGIDNNVELNETYTQKTQASAFINALNGYISHYPKQPDGVDDELYSLGYNGSYRSNLAVGFETMDKAIIYGFMNDGNKSNISKIGHRRWILNPPMRYTGFGAVYTDSIGFYSMYAVDEEGASDKRGVSWPAQTMPIEYFGAEYPWSISIGGSVNETTVKVKLTDVMTGQKWEFSSEGSDGDFYIDNSNWYGQSGCIIFRPEGINRYSSGDKFKVEITGLGVVGVEDSVSYEVNFFALTPYTFGDANSDGDISGKDVVLIKKYLAGYENLEINIAACDVNADGDVSGKDVVKIMKYLAGYDVVLGEN